MTGRSRAPSSPIAAGIPRTSLHYHLSLLRAAGLVEIALDDARYGRLRLRDEALDDLGRLLVAFVLDERGSVPGARPPPPPTADEASAPAEPQASLIEPDDVRRPGSHAAHLPVDLARHIAPGARIADLPRTATAGTSKGIAQRQGPDMTNGPAVSRRAVR